MTVVRSTRDESKAKVVIVQTVSPSYSNTVNSSFFRSWDNRVTRSDNIPDWRARIACGLNTSTSYTGESYRVKSRFGQAYRRTYLTSGQIEQFSANGEMIGMCFDPTVLPLPSPSDINKARSIAEIDFSKKFRKITRLWQSGVFAGELFQMAKLLTNPAASLRKSVDHLYKQMTKLYRDPRRNPYNRSTARALKEAVAGTYLEWEYAVRPTIGDLDDAAKAFRAIAQARTFDLLRFIGEGVFERTETGRNPFTAGSSWPSDSRWLSETNIHFRAEVTLRGAWKSDRPDGFMPLPMTLGTTLGDVLPTAWEFVPWSFLLDYFTNMGDVLDCWAMRSIEFAWLNQTTRLTTTVKCLPPPPSFFGGPGPGYTRQDFLIKPLGKTLVTETERKYITRFPYDNSWTPRFMAKMPEMGSRKWLNIAALASMQKVPSHISR